jgi:hypothetical protein
MLTDIDGVIPRYKLLEVESWSGFPFFVVDTDADGYDPVFPYSGSIRGGFPAREHAEQWASLNLGHRSDISDPKS